MSKIKLLIARLKILLVKKFIISKYCVINILGKFIPYFRNMDFTEERLLKQLNEFINNHLDKYSNKKQFSIEDAKNTKVFNSNDNSSKVEYIVSYEILHSKHFTYHFNVYCTGYFITKIEFTLSGKHLSESEEFDEVANFSKHFLNLKGQRINK